MKGIIAVLLITGFWILTSSYANAMGTAPPLPTKEIEVMPSASEEALAKEQIENLRNNAMNSETIQEAFNKAVGDIYAGKRYLYEFNSLATKELLRIAADKKEHWKLRIAAMSGLSADKTPAAYEVKRKIFEDKSERADVRHIAFLGLSTAKSPEKKREIVGLSINALKEDDWDNVASAANILAEIKDSKAVEPLIESARRAKNNLDRLLQSGWKGYEKGTQPEESALSCSVRALGEIGDKRAIQVLHEVITDRGLEADMGILHGTIGWSVIALEKINDREAAEAFADALSVPDSDIISIAKRALIKIGNFEKSELDKILDEVSENKERFVIEAQKNTSNFESMSNEERDKFFTNTGKEGWRQALQEHKEKILKLIK